MTPDQMPVLAQDRVDPWRMAALADTADGPASEDILHPLGHWCLFRPLAATATLSPDGHLPLTGPLARFGGMRRMWAGSEIRYLAPIPAGAEVTRTTTLTSVEEKTGRSGPFALLRQRHVLRVAGADVLEEVQDIVYRPPAPFGLAAGTVADRGQWQRSLTPSPVLLLRYSALTFNAHRIHYDLPYATAEEGYPGLVVHGPLTATLLIDLFRATCPDRPIQGFRFRAERPLFAGNPLTLHGRPTDTGAELWAADHTGALAVRASLDAGDPK